MDMDGLGEAVPLKKWVHMCVLGEAEVEFWSGFEVVQIEKGNWKK